MNRGIYTRGYLPHWDFEKSVQAITFRLADSVPKQVIVAWMNELAAIPDVVHRQKELHLRIAKYEDLGHGSSVLRQHDIAMILQNKLLEGHPGKYKLIEWCIMPNHVHVLVKLAEMNSLADIVRLWKGGSAIDINRALHRTGPLWQREYYDRFVRDMDHFHDCVAYIRNNPVRAKLCSKPEDWPCSSAGSGWNGALASAGEDKPRSDEPLAG